MKVPVIRQAFTRVAAPLVRRLIGRTDGAASAKAQAIGAFDLTDPDGMSPPFPTYAHLRHFGPVHFLPRNDCWIILGYDEVKEALSRPTLFSSAVHKAIDPVMLGEDPPVHTRARRAVAPMFSGAVLDGLCEALSEDAARLIQPTFDVVADYAVPLTRRATARLVGLNPFDPEISSGRFKNILGTAVLDRDLQALLRRSQMYRTLTAGHGVEAFGDADALSLVRLFCSAGAEPTERLIVRAAVILLEERQIRTAVEREPALIGPFLEEVLRLFPSEPNAVRWTKQAVRMGGVEIPKGARVLLSLLSANRDPARYWEPDRIRLDRGRSGHFGFGSGPHQCIGAGMARRLSHRAVACLLERSYNAAESLDRLELHPVQRIMMPRRLPVRT